MPTTKTESDKPAITTATHMTLWHEYATAALQGCLAFHGADRSSCNAGAEHVACIADGMVAAYIERLTELKDEELARREKE